MTSPQYSTPYSALSFPTYTPLSVPPVKQDGSPVGADPLPYRAAVRADMAHQHATHTSALQLPYAPSAAVNNGAECSPSNVGTTSRVQSSELFSAAPHLTRANAPLYAPPGAVKVAPVLLGGAAPPVPAAEPHYSDIAGVRDLSSVPPTRQSAFHSYAPAVVMVDGTEVDVQSDVVSVTEAAPNLCAFQQECQSLLALLNASSRPRRVAPSPNIPAVLSKAPLSPVADNAATSALESALRPERQLLAIPSAQAPTSTLSSAEASPSSPSLASGRVRVKADKVGTTHSTTYAQLVKEMDDLASLLKEEEELRRRQSAVSRQPSGAGANLAQGARAGVTATETALLSVRATNSLADTPEKLRRPTAETHRRDLSWQPSVSFLAQGPAEVVHAPTGSFWAAQLLKWIIFLVEQRQSALQRIQAFEDARAPGRRGACRSAVTNDSAANLPPSVIRVTDGLLRLLRSLDPVTSDVDTWTTTQQRHMCTRMANLLAEMTATEEAVMADLLNDAAAGATLEREGTAKEPSTSVAVASPPVHDVSEAYRQDMRDTIALLEGVSQENKALKLRIEQIQGEAAKLSDEVERETAAKKELGEYFDGLASENSRLTVELREMEAKLRQAETLSNRVSQEEALRNQLDRQTLHLRDVRAELDDVKNESDTLRSTIRQLREALVRHRAVIDLLTRRRRARERSAAAITRESGSRCSISQRPKSPPLQLIDDILAGVCDPPPTPSSSAPSEEKDSDDGDACGDSGSRSSRH
ncbi:hypothetical protein GH5_07511 [Leishmania sp. Ghana 2012 LV757]|uniref:hypothetical protein n=1 Tax=Leishmania sp. Ghana 2012 LV757 TaxID=2803181 RepID=UPI001B70C71C|nr:hypothetical protein GH5_07511 [Leishmania sp. Ghana 2012 LV757]